MENVCISDKYGVAIGTSDNPVYIQGSAGGGVPITVPSDSEFPMVRGNEPIILTYNASTDPALFVDKRKYSMVAVQIPAAANGLTMTPLAAENTGGIDSKGIPKFYSSDGTLTSFYGKVVSGGDWIVLQAEIAPIPYLGLRFSVAITGEVKVWLMG